MSEPDQFAHERKESVTLQVAAEERFPADDGVEL